MVGDKWQSAISRPTGSWVYVAYYGWLASGGVMHFLGWNCSSARRRIHDYVLRLLKVDLKRHLVRQAEQAGRRLVCAEPTGAKGRGAARRSLILVRQGQPSLVSSGAASAATFLAAFVALANFAMFARFGFTCRGLPIPYTTSSPKRAALL